ncbi:glycosyltransferase [Robertkochia marina]|uniref:Glycosyltransferase n=1 Tax=Robertkochia marina TaxID=1227945 RepID=A0A4V3UY76_9FLAO|nr:glycosyltransferase [Robertkochia marina]THD68046.1 glycosyltransferase [Robertkochia marina]TRZ42670.1 glycosyltransferase [Robertkochia marina]
MDLSYSFVVPVYNRPQEIKELLESMTALEGEIPFEVVIVEDGSTLDSEAVITGFSDLLNISYYKKPNTGPGDSRNYGMKRAGGNYFIILDSDCLLPASYMETVHRELQGEYTDCFGGPDAAHPSFTDLQKAINFTMTSFLTTGGIRGGKKAVDKFQPRSFNMGISKKAFEATGGFGIIHPGEDPDLTIRIWKAGFTTRLISGAYVYHKRRISWKSFYNQVKKFGKTRPILNSWHPHTKKITYWFPTFFIAGLLMAVLLALWGWPYWLYGYAVYFVLVFLGASLAERSLRVGFMSVIAVSLQFTGYGLAFAYSHFLINLMRKDPEKTFPGLFFN